MKVNILFYTLIWLLPAALFSCAKENLPVDKDSDEAYNKLYFSDVNTALSSKIRINTNVGSRDTTVFSYQVDIGGNFRAPQEIPVKFTVLPDAYVQAFDNDNVGAYLPLPADAYKMVTDTVIHSGQASTGLLPLVIYKDKLKPLTDYILPIQVAASDATFKVDLERSIKYILISSRTMQVGLKIGNVPQLADPRADLFDFYGDLMLKDTAGNLWFIPLESNGNREMGEPVMVATGFKQYECLFFHPFYQMIFGVDTQSPCSSNWSSAATGCGHPYSFAVTPYPHITVGPPKRLTSNAHQLTNTSPATYNEDWGYQLYTAQKRRRFFAGVNGFTHVIYYPPRTTTATSLWHSKFNRLDANGQFTTANRKDQSSWSFGIKSGCTINDRQFFLTDDVALIYASYAPMAGNYPVYNYVTPASYPDFGARYAKAFSVYQRDLVCYTYTGDVIRYESPTFEDMLRP